MIIYNICLEEMLDATYPVCCETIYWRLWVKKSEIRVFEMNKKINVKCK